MSDDPQAENAKVNDLSAKRALKDEAEALLDEAGVFMRAVRSTRIGWYRELMDTREEHVERNLLAQLRALDAVPQLLQGAINDYKMGLHQQQRQKHA